MSEQLNENLLKTINGGATIMAHSLSAYCILFKKWKRTEKKKLTKQQARDNYCKSVLFLWGYMQYELDQVDDNDFYRAQLMSAYILFGVLSRKEFEILYLGAGLSKKKGKDYPELCYEMIKWFNKNEKHPGAQSIITTGKHVFTLRAFSGKLEDKHKEAFYNMGSLCEEGFEAINCMKSILVDSKLKLNF